MIKGFAREYYITVDDNTSVVLIDRKHFFKKRELLLFEHKNKREPSNPKKIQDKDVLNVTRITSIKTRKGWVPIREIKKDKLNITLF